jgi:adenylate cyclase
MATKQPARILVVDDNEMNRDMLSRRLQRQRYDVEMAENGERCLDLMRNRSFDLVLLDVMMPKMNGYEVLEQAKADDDLRHIPVIMISAVDDLDSVVRCIELGAEDYLFKPFNPVLLKARIGATLDKYRSGSGTTKPVLDRILHNTQALADAGDLNPAQQELLQAIMTDTQHLLE